MAEAAEAAGGSWTIWQQFGVQAAAVGIAIAYAGVLTLILVFIVDKIFKFRSTDKEEMAGLDRSYHGERGYGLINPN
jgi:Amt family ammonium transporter